MSPDDVGSAPDARLTPTSLCAASSSADASALTTGFGALG